MIQALHDRLISVLDAYIGEYGGKMRVRGILTALLILRSSLNGRSISISEIRQRELSVPVVCCEIPIPQNTIAAEADPNSRAARRI